MLWLQFPLPSPVMLTEPVGQILISGLARVAQQVLDLGTMDVLLLAGAYESKPKPHQGEKRADHVIVVGRVRSRVDPAINLNSIFAEFGGGGHAKVRTDKVPKSYSTSCNIF